MTYLRARVSIALDKPLVRFVPITLKETKRYLVQYEKLPVFCYICGLMGHELMECGDGVHDPRKCRWGDWLLVKFLVVINRGSNQGGGGRGGTWSRGRGRGRGDAKRGCFGGRGEWMEDDVEDIKTFKGEDDDIDGMAAKKREAYEVEGRGCVA